MKQGVLLGDPVGIVDSCGLLGPAGHVAQLIDGESFGMTIQAADDGAAVPAGVDVSPSAAIV